jgi:hypothetical protein
MFVKQIFEDFENLENKKESNLNKCLLNNSINVDFIGFSDPEMIP